METPVEEIEITAEMIGEDQEPELVGGPDIEDAFEPEGAGGLVDRRGGMETDLVPGGIPIDIEGEHEASVAERIILKREIGEGCIATEIGVAALVDLQGEIDIGDEVFDEQVGSYIGPPLAGIGEFCVLQEGEGLFGG